MNANFQPFESAKLGPIELRNRIIKTATFEGPSANGQVSRQMIDYHLSFANGGVGMTTAGYMAVSPEGKSHHEAIVVGRDTAVGLSQLASEVHATGAKISAQLGHAGPVANGKSNGVKGYAPSRFFSPMSMQTFHVLTAADFPKIIKSYTEAAQVIVDSGFDAIELHLSHGYLLSSFLSPKINRRKDKYGGDLASRSLFPREVIGAIKQKIGDQVAFIGKTSLSDGSPYAASPAELLQYAKLLDSDGVLDGLELTAGSSLLNPLYMFRGGVPVKEFAAEMDAPLKQILNSPAGKMFFKSYPYQEAYLLEMAQKFRQEVKLPLILLGGISDLGTIEQGLAAGFEFVAMGRALLREPDLINRYQAGTASKSLCIHCNRCIPTIYSQTRCTEISPGVSS